MYVAAADAVASSAFSLLVRSTAPSEGQNWRLPTCVALRARLGVQPCPTPEQPGAAQPLHVWLPVPELHASAGVSERCLKA